VLVPAIVENPQGKEPLWQQPNLCRARLQPCRKPPRTKTALAAGPFEIELPHKLELALKKAIHARSQMRCKSRPFSAIQAALSLEMRTRAEEKENGWQPRLPAVEKREKDAAAPTCAPRRGTRHRRESPHHRVRCLHHGSRPLHVPGRSCGIRPRREQRRRRGTRR